MQFMRIISCLLFNQNKRTGKPRFILISNILALYVLLIFCDNQTMHSVTGNEIYNYLDI